MEGYSENTAPIDMFQTNAYNILVDRDETQERDGGNPTWI